jgi:hypothetical protein
MIVANSQGNLAEALLHGWRAHDLSPPDSDLQHETLSNLTRTALEAGFFEAARSGFDYIVQHGRTLRIRIPALGGAVRAAAALKDRTGVSRLVEVGRTEIGHGATAYDTARFFLWCAQSWHTLGEPQLRDVLATEAQEVSTTFGFHEVAMRAEKLLATPITGKDSRAPRTLYVTNEQTNRAVVTVGIERLAALSIG